MIHHSDRGVQYASHDYRAVLSAAGIIGSMSRKADCYDNAPMESFFHTLKTELVHHRQYKTRAEGIRIERDKAEIATARVTDEVTACTLVASNLPYSSRRVAARNMKLPLFQK